ncbi:MAG: type 4a pilus biogenesis protein PilO [Elusimicrobia bacterium]|nr:type 4a pilus biogenesis protein PilO [Elusimicrobiota bacterium]
MALPKLTKQQQQMIAVGVVCVGGLGFLYVKFFWLPTSARIVAAETVIADLEKKIKTAKETAARRPQIEADLATLRTAAQEAEKRLPKTKSVPDILVTAQGLAKKHSVSLTSFSPGAQKAQQYYTELTYQLQVRGGYHSIGKFLAGLALEERLYNVSNVVYAAPDDKGQMQVSFILTSYQYKG